MKKIKFKIAIRENPVISELEVTGRHVFDMFGFHFILHHLFIAGQLSEKFYTISEYSTGSVVSERIWETEIESAIKQTREYLETKGENAVKEAVKELKKINEIEMAVAA